MICPKCGETYEEKYNFCIICGTKLISAGEKESQEKIKKLENEINKLKLRNLTLESKIEQSKEQIIKYKKKSEGVVKEHSINLVETNIKMKEELEQTKIENEKLKEEISELESQKELSKKDKKELKDKIYKLEGEIIKLKQDNTAKDREIRKLERKSTGLGINIPELVENTNTKNKKVYKKTKKVLVTENKKPNPRFYGDAETKKFNQMKTNRIKKTQKNNRPKFNALPNYYHNKSKQKAEYTQTKKFDQTTNQITNPQKNNRAKFNALPKYYNKNKSNSPNPAIYKIVNNRTGEVFVSNSIDIEKGKKRHLSNLKNGTHHNPDIQDDYNKGDSFSFVILEEFDYYDRKEINQITKEYIKKENSYNYGYNRYSGGGYDPYKNNKHHSTGRRLDGRGSSRK